MKWIVAVSLIACLSLPCFCQQPTSPASLTPPSLEALPTVSVFFVLTDSKGRPVPDAVLTNGDLQVEHDGKRAEVVEVRRAEDFPIRIALLLDLSGSSLPSNYALLATMAAESLQANLRTGRDSAVVIAFRDKISEAIPLHADELAEQLKSATYRGGTALYDAFIQASNDLVKLNPGLSRRVILVLSDGEDNASMYGLVQTKQSVLHTGIAIYTLNTSDLERSRRARRALTELTRSTGGRLFEPNSIQDVRRALDDFMQDLKCQYLVTYRPSDPPAGKPHTLRITVSKEKKLRILVRDEYYAMQE